MSVVDDFTETMRPREPVARNRRTPVIGAIMIVIGLFSFFVFGLGTHAGSHSQLTFDPLSIVNAPWHTGALTFDAHWTNIALGLLMILIGVEVLWRRPQRFVMGRFGIVSLLFLFTLLIWASRGPGPSPINFINVTSLLVGASATTMVLVFGSLSAIMCERSGVVNIAIEGQFIAGAFLGSMIASTTSNFFYAAVGGVVIGGLIGLVLAFFSLRYQTDQIIVGIVLVTMLSSLSSYLNLQVLTPFPNFNTGNTAPNLPIPFLYKIPVIGPVFFNQSGFWYAMIVLIFVVSFALFKTQYGLHVRAVGEHPQAAATVGIHVIRLRYINVVLGGAIAGLGGVAFMATQGQFQVGYTSGLGYIALAAMIFGKWRPSGALVASIIFGLSVYLSYELVTYQVPVSLYVLQMFPYLITIAVVAGLIGRVRPPAADGKPYIPG
ncbi:MAG: ABC transporter permease [Acidimicrobiales bacterium]|jgi:general nucleoside transport system permease protein